MEEVEGEEQVEKEEKGDMEEVEGEEQVVEEDEAKDGVEGRKRKCRDLVLWLAMAVTRFKKTFIYRI